MKDLRLYSPTLVQEMDREKYLSGGCGPQGWKLDLIPDKLFGVSIIESCRIHDAMYSLGLHGLGLKGSESHRGVCDRVFLNNMIRTVNGIKWQLPFIKQYRLWLANKYFKAVRNFGGPAYWDNKNLETEILTIKD